MAAKLSGSGGGGIHAPSHNADINVTPFVDIMLVLLIIFMVAIPLATTSLKLNMPPAPNVAVPDKPVILSLQKDGRLILSPDRVTSLASVAGELAAIGKGPADTIMVRADADVPYGRFMALVNTLQADGFAKVSLITENL